MGLFIAGRWLDNYKLFFLDPRWDLHDQWVQTRGGWFTDIDWGLQRYSGLFWSLPCSLLLFPAPSVLVGWTMAKSVPREVA
jgi:hypothetical protein